MFGVSFLHVTLNNRYVNKVQNRRLQYTKNCWSVLNKNGRREKVETVFEVNWIVYNLYIIYYTDIMRRNEGVEM